MLSLSVPRLFLALVAALGLANLAPHASGYALENKHWPDGAVVKLQMSLGSPGRPLQDGTTSWNVAAVPAPAHVNE